MTDRPVGHNDAPERFSSVACSKEAAVRLDRWRSSHGLRAVYRALGLLGCPERERRPLTPRLGGRWRARRIARQSSSSSPMPCWEHCGSNSDVPLAGLEARERSRRVSGQNRTSGGLLPCRRPLTDPDSARRVPVVFRPDPDPARRVGSTGRSGPLSGRRVEPDREMSAFTRAAFASGRGLTRPDALRGRRFGGGARR